ncbi:MAG TPA: protein kinase [Nocardioides sp.]|nr:protein kinase [Nocardioides sp.]
MSEQYADAAHRYRLDERIATGGMGVVWKATDTRLGRTVAVKVLKHEYADDDMFRQRFETEARHAASLHHPGICGVYDYSSDVPVGGAPYLVMEYVDGQPLSALLAQGKESGRTMDPEIVRDLMTQTAAALAVAHQAGIVHRDVKPANLIITPDRRVKVTDFGIARAGDATAITRTGAVMGTPQYLSPEQARGDAATFSSDVYSLGCVAYECLTGNRPFEAETPVATLLAHLQQPVPPLPPSVPGDLARVVTRAMAKKPAQRFADGAELAAALRNPEAVAPVPAAAVAPVPAGDATAVLPQTATIPPAGVPIQRLDTASAYAGREAERRDRGPWVALALVVAFVLIAILVAYLLLHSNNGTPATFQSSPATTATTRSSKPTTPTTTATTPNIIRLNAADYVGRDFHVVSGELAAKNLNVQLDAVPNDGTHPAGIVTQISPSGAVTEGQIIKVTYWDNPAPTTAPTTPTTPTSAATSTDSASALIAPPLIEQKPEGPGR